MPETTESRTHHTFTDAQGVTIHYYVWTAKVPRGVVQITHGLGEHALRHERLAKELVAAGYTVYANDHRGHGATGLEQYDGDVTRMGRLGSGGLRATINDIRHFTAIIRGENPHLPLAAIGQSWGSLMLQKIINGNAGDFDAVVLAGTAYRTLRHMNSGNLNARHKHLGTTGNEWLSREASIAQQFADDPLTFYADARRLFGIPDGMRLLGRPSRKVERDIPVLILIGSEDSLGGEKSIARLAAAYVKRSRLTDVQAIVYPGARHEVFNETNRDEVVADLLAWLDSRLTPIEAGSGKLQAQ